MQIARLIMGIVGVWAMLGLAPAWAMMGDMDGNGCIDQVDIYMAVSCFGQTAPLAPPCDAADVVTLPDGDGNVNILDLSYIGSQMGNGCGSIPGDVDDSGCVDMADINIVVGCFGQTTPLSPPCDAADASPAPDGDGNVNILDVSYVGSKMGEGC